VSLPTRPPNIGMRLLMPKMLVSSPPSGNRCWICSSPQSGERILDLGCGDGVLTEKLVMLGAQVVAIDNSPDMIAAAL
jgi:2-polyprenyl-3-methyl-5-hydroxy-6-metoxy-1,4-benzoquinol methylase